MLGLQDLKRACRRHIHRRQHRMYKYINTLTLNHMNGHELPTPLFFKNEIPTKP